MMTQSKARNGGPPEWQTIIPLKCHNCHQDQRRRHETEKRFQQPAEDRGLASTKVYSYTSNCWTPAGQKTATNTNLTHLWMFITVSNASL